MDLAHLLITVPQEIFGFFCFAIYILILSLAYYIKKTRCMYITIYCFEFLRGGELSIKIKSFNTQKIITLIFFLLTLCLIAKIFIIKILFESIKHLVKRLSKGVHNSIFSVMICKVAIAVVFFAIMCVKCV